MEPSNISSSLLKFFFEGAVVLTTAFGSSASATAVDSPKVSKVAFSGTPSDQIITVTGTGFGTKPPGIPCNNCTNKYIFEYDGTQNRIYGYNGYSGDRGLNIISWSNTSIVTSGFVGDPGDNFLLWLWNARTKRPAAWGGNIPSQFTTPKIKSLTLSGSGVNLRITIAGSGFGSAPTGVPGLANVDNLEVCDLRPINSAGNVQNWCAGYSGDLVNLNYESWTNTKIVILGFGTNYGLKGRLALAGDPITVRIFTTGYPAHGGFGGPQTAASAVVR